MFVPISMGVVELAVALLFGFFPTTSHMGVKQPAPLLLALVVALLYWLLPHHEPHGGEAAGLFTSCACMCSSLLVSSPPRATWG
jgi:hypothetical protein